MKRCECVLPWHGSVADTHGETGEGEHGLGRHPVEENRHHQVAQQRAAGAPREERRHLIDRRIGAVRQVQQCRADYGVAHALTSQVQYNYTCTCGFIEVTSQAFDLKKGFCTTRGLKL